MPRLVNSAPKYRRHKASDQAIVSIAGKDHYLGPWRSKVSRSEYDRIVGEWIANGRRAPSPCAMSDLTVSELVAAYWRFADGYYRKDGEPSGSIPGIKRALHMLRTVYGHTLARDFGPLALAALRQRLIDAGNTRTYINDHMGRFRRVFKWAASQELVAVSVYQGLMTVPGLRRGRSAARELEPIGPVSTVLVEATLPYLPPVVADMVRFQRVTGARPIEVCLLRPCDVDRSVEPWAYRPRLHKTEHHGRARVIFIGPRGQEILRPYLLREGDRHCFSPAESEAARKAALRARRKTKVQPSQRDRRKRRPECSPGDQYDTCSYRRAIHRACDVADCEAQKADEAAGVNERIVPRWSPNQLRHSVATEIRSRFGLEAAATVLGHAKADVTQLYAERDLTKAASIMREVG